jgi:hypothetical protein
MAGKLTVALDYKTVGPWLDWPLLLILTANSKLKELVNNKHSITVL